MMSRYLPSLLAVLFGVGLSGSSVFAINSNEKKTTPPQIGSQVEIDRVDFVGVKLFPTQTIEETLEIGPGDLLERVKVIRTEENLQALYLSRGYESVRISSRLVRKKTPKNSFENSLEFSVIEGKPIRIASIFVVPSGMSEEVLKSSWKRQESQLASSLSLKPGDLLDREKIAQTKRTLQELLASNEYIGARVETLDIRSKIPKELAETPLKEDAARWVSLEYRISLGDRVSFGFRGNTIFTWGYLQGLVDEQRLLGLGKDYVGVIRTRIENEYEAAGYAKSNVVPYTVERALDGVRKVTYMIEEGPRVKIDSVTFDGNIVFSPKELRALYMSRAAPMIQRGVFVEKDAQKAAELLIDSMKEKGYLSAKLVTVNAIYTRKPRTQKANPSVKLVIYLYEGDQTMIQNVAVSGATVFKKEKLQELLKVKEGEPLNLFSFAEGLEIIKQYYREKGYLSFRVANEGTDSVIQYSQENRYADIDVQVEEGPQYRVSTIQFEGLVVTQEAIARRELLFKEEGVLSESSLMVSKSRLSKMGIFSSVEIHPLDDPEKPNYKIIRISVQESDRGILTGGPGIRNDLGIRGFGQLAYTNLWGLNHTISVSGSANRRFYLYNFGEGQAQVLYNWPWFVGLPDVTFRPSISVGRTQYYNLATDNYTAAANWERQILAKPNLVANLSYTFEWFTQFMVPGSDNLSVRAGSVTPKFTLDMRDNSLSPTSGFYATTWFDYSSPMIGSQLADSSQNNPEVNYFRFQFRSDYYIPLPLDIVLSFSFRGGLEQSPAGAQTPLLKLFTLGGVQSLRGYQEQQLNITTLNPGYTKNNPLFNSGLNSLVGSTFTYLNTRTQVDLPLSGALKFGVFLDSARFFLNSTPLTGMLFGTGGGLHYQTPIGSVNLDVGFKVAPPMGTDAYVIHFSVGAM